MDNLNILEEIRSGSKEAIQKVYTENAKDVYEFTNSLIHDSARSKEITKSTFVNLFKKINAGESPEDIRHAAMMLAYDEALEFMPASEPEEKTAEAEEIIIEEATEEEPAEEAAESSVEYEEPAKEEETVEEEVVISEEPVAAAGAGSVTRIIPSDEIEEEEPEVFSTVEMAESIKAKLSAAAAASPETEEKAEEPEKETVEDIVLEEDVRFVGEEPEDFFEDNSDPNVTRTQVIDISEAPEESDVIIAEAEEEFENGEYEDEFDDEYDDDDYDEDEKPKRGGFFTVLVIINIILIILLLWLLVGLLVNLGVLPENLDLGYTWFNQHIFPIF